MSLHVFLIAGEPSGDVLGARLMAALRSMTGGGQGVRFSGVGGPLMAAEGLESLFPMDELTLFGLAEILPKIPALKRRIDQTVAAARDAAPDVLVTIDSPGFSYRVGRRLGDRRFPLIHYVAPSVWAWKPGRARKVAAFLDHLMALLPFEPPYFEREGLPTTFVGHPIVESGAGSGDGARFRAAHGLPGDAPVLCVLPGSRGSELRRLGGPFGETVGRLGERHPDLRVVVPTLAGIEGAVRDLVAGWPRPALVVTGDAAKYDAFAAADAALAASGTVALELALAGTPSVIGYRVAPATAILARLLLRTRYVNLVNILEDAPVVPELLQERCEPGRLSVELARLLEDPGARAAQRAVIDRVASRLGRDGPPPSRRAAEVVVRVAGEGRRRLGA
ncbi:MAG: lipid-A-disaccharide synthase [Azospirillaceae bacterium]